jgi:hypothetical protein
VGDEQQVADQPQQPARVAVHDAEEAPVVVGQRRVVLEHQLQVADDRGQRRAQLVRDQGEELVLEDLGLALGRLALQVLPDLLAEVHHDLHELVVARARLGGAQLEHAKRGGAAEHGHGDHRRILDPDHVTAGPCPRGDALPAVPGRLRALVLGGGRGPLRVQP